MFKIIILFILFLYSGCVWAGQPLAIFGDWTVFTNVNRKNRLLCYTVSIPQKRYDNFNKRGQSFFTVIIEKGKEEPEIYLSHGQVWRKGIRNAELDIVKRKFPLYTYEDKAWAYNTYDDKNIIEELSKSAMFSMTVDFYGNKKSIDIYSLNGFNESLEEIKKLCGEQQNTSKKQ